MTFRHALVALVSLLLISACVSSRPVVDTGSKPPTQEGTVAGKVSTDSNAPVVSRRVRIVPVDGGTPYEVTTNDTGAYSVKVRPGRYRLEVDVRPGERIVKQPEETDVNPSDLDPNRDFVIAAAR
jgi:hypothetical protein